MSDVALIHLTDEGATLRLGPFILTPTGLIAQGEPTFEEWAPVGPILKRIEGAVQFWWGDWCNYGERHFGERFSQALEASGYEEGTLRNCAYVARAIPPARRRDGVPFAIHQEVAPLPPDEQDRWLDRAQQTQMTRAELRKAIRRERMGAVDDTRGLQPDGAFIALSDDGNLRLLAKVVDGKIELHFERPTRWLGLTVKEAYALIRLLEDRIETAHASERKEDGE